jgi:aryl-alcohol dehydrogenase-like predicted oxidoreductase
MKLTNLYKSGVHLTPIGLGCEQLGGTDWGSVDINDLYNTINVAWEMGVRVFDTADVYGLGRSEIELANALGDKRHDAVIVSKFGCRWSTPKLGNRATITKDASPNYARSSVEASLKRLRVEAIPLYLIHWPDEKTPLEETLEVLEKCREQGKILSYGLSNFNWEKCEAVKDNYPLSALEGPYSLVNIHPGNVEYAKARNAGLEILTYGPLAQGLLTGKYNEKIKFDLSDRRHRLPQFSKDSLLNSKELLFLLSQAAREHQKTPAQVALRWILDQEFVSTVLVGSKTPSQVIENIGALGWQLDPFWSKKLSLASKNSL